MNLDHLSFEFATLAETTQVHFISKGNIYQFNFCQVCVSYLAERVGFFHRMTFNLSRLGGNN